MVNQRSGQVVKRPGGVVAFLFGHFARPSWVFRGCASGGALKTDYVFGYGARTRQILIPSDLWIEFSHLGYWQNSLYGQLSHTIEVTALQRGVGRGAWDDGRYRKSVAKSFLPPEKVIELRFCIVCRLALLGINLGVLFGDPVLKVG